MNSDSKVDISYNITVEKMKLDFERQKFYIGTITSFVVVVLILLVMSYAIKKMSD